MANLTREEIIKRGYVTDPFVVNSNVDVDSELFKAAITDRFYYDLIYRGDGEKSQVKSALKEKVIEIQEPVTIIEEVVEPVKNSKTATSKKTTNNKSTNLNKKSNNASKSSSTKANSSKVNKVNNSKSKSTQSKTKK